MNKDIDTDIRKLMAERPGVSGYTQKYGSKRRSNAFFNRAVKKKKLVVVGAGILFGIILIGLFSGGGGRQSAGELASIRASLKQVEERLTRLEKMADKIAELEKQQAALRRLTGEKLDQLAQTGRGRQRERTNLVKRRYHEVQPGDSLSRIAEEHGISLDELCRLNNITREEVIHPGQKLLVGPDRHR